MVVLDQGSPGRGNFGGISAFSVPAMVTSNAVGSSIHTFLTGQRQRDTGSSLGSSAPDEAYFAMLPASKRRRDGQRLPL